MAGREELSKVRSRVLAEWIDAAFSVYPDQTVRLFNSIKDQFQNPVGGTIRSGLAELLDLVWSDAPIDGVPEALDRIVRIRSVQALSAEQALRFWFDLKRVLREAREHNSNESFVVDLDRLSERIDRLMLLSFGAYQACREQLYQIRANEEKARNTKLLQRAQEIIHNHATGQDGNMKDMGETHQPGGGRR